MRKICIFCLVFVFFLLIEAVNLESGTCQAQCYKDEGCKFSTSCACSEFGLYTQDCSCSAIGCGVKCSWWDFDLFYRTWSKHTVEKSCNGGGPGNGGGRTEM
jgi:hypothetical protein